jgi:hypothetical protein
MIPKTKERISIMPPKPSLRTIITNSDSKKWKGCIYLSSSDLTGQILLFLKTVISDYQGKFLKNDIYVFTSANKSEVEAKITDKLQSILKRN